MVLVHNFFEMHLFNVTYSSILFYRVCTANSANATRSIMLLFHGARYYTFSFEIKPVYFQIGNSLHMHHHTLVAKFSYEQI